MSTAFESIRTTYLYTSRNLLLQACQDVENEIISLMKEAELRSIDFTVEEGEVSVDQCSPAGKEKIAFLIINQPAVALLFADDSHTINAPGGC